MTIEAEINPAQDRLWFPLLESLGYRRPVHSSDVLDQTEATDIFAGGYWFAVRSRNSSSYTQAQLAQYLCEFTIRYKRPSGSPTEWKKLFQGETELPDYMAYGWWATKKHMDAYVIISVPELQRCHTEGVLREVVSGPFKNKDRRQSTFYAVSIPKLHQHLSQDRFDALFVHWSDNHPCRPQRGLV